MISKESKAYFCYSDMAPMHSLKVYYFFLLENSWNVTHLMKLEKKIWSK